MASLLAHKHKREIEVMAGHYTHSMARTQSNLKVLNDEETKSFDGENQEPESKTECNETENVY